jgi:ribose 5-phosphate isomerase B
VRIGLGSDEIGFECKERLKARFSGQGHAAEDISTGDLRRTDYQSTADQLASGRVERGVLICSRAIGASVMANKHSEVRAALCHDLNSARHGVQDDDMNLLVMGAGLVRPARAGVRHSSAAFGARRRVHPKQSRQTARR